VRRQLCPTGVLRAGINMSNFLLVTARDSQGQPGGVSPDLARAMADRLEVPLSLLPYPGPGQLADSLADWDIGNIANEKERAKTISFSPPYCEIQACYLVAPGSAIQTVAEVDRAGVRVVVKQRSAYDLWLTENLQQATLVRTETVEQSFVQWQEQGYEVLAGLRPRLLTDSVRAPGSTLLPGSFTTIGQSVGLGRGRGEQAELFVSQFVEEAKTWKVIQQN